MSKINDTPEAWEDGTLGRDAAFAERLDPETWAKEQAELDEALGLKAISIRLDRALIEDFKMIAALNRMGYQPLMRQALKRFADCEKKRILTEAYNAMKERQDTPADETKEICDCDSECDCEHKLAA